MFSRGDHVKIISKSVGYPLKKLKFHEGFVHKIFNAYDDKIYVVTYIEQELGHPLPSITDLYYKFGHFRAKDLQYISPIDLSDIDSSFEELLNDL